MIAEKVRLLEQENRLLKDILEEMKEKMGQEETPKPKSCKYCKNYVQHYRKAERGQYVAIYGGHCASGVPIKRGGKRSPKPDDSCPYFELGAYEEKSL